MGPKSLFNPKMAVFCGKGHLVPEPAAILSSGVAPAFPLTQRVADRAVWRTLSVAMRVEIEVKGKIFTHKVQIFSVHRRFDPQAVMTTNTLRTGSGTSEVIKTATIFDTNFGSRS